MKELDAVIERFEQEAKIVKEKRDALIKAMDLIGESFSKEQQERLLEVAKTIYK